MKVKTALIAVALCIAAPAALFSQSVTQVVNTVAVGSITGLGTGVAALLGGTSSGTVGLAGTTSPTFITPVLGAATATSINFGGTSLSTYVEGTWTPAITGASTPGTGQTYAANGQIGSYERVGRQVTARFTVLLTSVGTASGVAQISLPLAAANVTNDFGTCSFSNYTLASNTALNYGVIGLISPNSSIVALNTNAGTAQSTITVAQVGNAGVLVGVCNYRAS